MNVLPFTLLLPYFQRTFASTLEDLAGDKVTNLLDPIGLTCFYYFKNFFLPPFFIGSAKIINFLTLTTFSGKSFKEENWKELLKNR